MNENRNSMDEWVDPDDAPDLTEFNPDLDKGTWHVGGKKVTAEEGIAAFRDRVTKKQVNMMLDQDIINHFKRLAGGRGYQTLINQTLREVMQGDQLKKALREVIREELMRH